MILKLNAQLFWAKLQFCSLFPFWARETLTGMIEEKKAKEKHIYMGGNYPRNTGQKGIDKKKWYASDSMRFYMNEVFNVNVEI